MGHDEIIDILKLAGGIASAVLVAVATAVGFLMRTAFKLGHDAKEIREGLDAIRDIKVAVAELPVLKNRLGTVEEAWRSTRSDIKHLLRGSNPFLNGAGED